MKILSNVRVAYDMRSQYIHHRVSIHEEEELETFVWNARSTLSIALQQLARFKTEVDFIEAIDRRKFGG
jgi:hypothetical protein